MRSKTRILSLLLCLVLLLGLLPAVGYAEGGEAERIYGNTRYETSLLTADAYRAALGGVEFDTIVVAYGENFADALGGSYLAIQRHAPILVVKPATIGTVKTYIEENMSPGGSVYILGGEGVVPKEMEDGLDDYYVKRLAGSNRFGTNLEILREQGIRDGDPILICSAYGFADSLSASASGFPILLVGNSLTAEQEDFIANLPGRHTYIMIGGEGAVSRKVAEQCSSYGRVERVGGANRYETSRLVAERFFDAPSKLVLAYGQNYPDGLCGAPLANALNAPLLLVTSQRTGEAQKYALAHNVSDTVTLGGPTLISEYAVEKIVNEEPEDDRLAAEAWNYDPANYWDESAAKYDAVLGEFYEYYQQAMASDSVAGRYALEAIAEAKLLGAGVMLPTTTRGGSYAISRVAPKTINSTFWGNDYARFHDALVATEFIKVSDREALKAKWAELAGTGTYLDWAASYLTGHGYTLTDVYNLSYTSDPQTWDGLATYRSADSEAIVNTIDGLLEYDVENVQQPALAESYEVNDDFTVYTFHLRQGAQWSDSQGRVVGEVTADDFVAGMQHLLDVQGGLEGLAADDGVKIVNATAYLYGEVTDFSRVGVKALDDYTVQYTLEEPCTWFTTLLGYNPFFPLCRSYYTSQGGKFGAAFDAGAANYYYGKDPDHIAYCGPYLVTNATEANTIVFEANPNYWNKDSIRIHTITWKFNDGSDYLKAYNDAKNGLLSGASLNTAALEWARADGLFDEFAYVSDTSSTTYLAFFNLMRNQFSNFNDPNVAVSQKTVSQAKAYNTAMGNLHFRRALMCSVDRASYNAQSVGEELKLNNLRNSYTPANFVALPEGVTVDINGAPTFFAAGTYYGEIMQAQLDADRVAITVWDPTADGGIGSGDGFDGWYNPAYVQSELALAVEELAAKGLHISKDRPIVIEIPYAGNSEVRTNRANVVKRSIEASFGGLVKVTLIDCGDTAGWLYAGYYPDYGYEINADFMDVSGWGPDYGDPQSYLATMTPWPGGMIKSCGIF